MKIENKDESNYIISIQNIEQKNSISSINNLNSINSLKNLENQNQRSFIISNDQGKSYSSFFKKEIESRKRKTQNKSQKLLPSIKKKIIKQVSLKFGLKKFHSKIFFKRKKFFQNDFENKKVYDPRYLNSLIKNFEYKSNEGKANYKIQKLHLLISFLLLFNFIIGVIDNLINKKNSNKIIEEGYINNNEYEKILNKLKKRKLTKEENFLRVVSLLCSIIMIILLIRKEIIIQKNNLIYYSLLNRIIIFIICSIFYLPKLNPIYIIKSSDRIYPLFLVDIYFLLSVSKIFIFFLINLDFSKFGTLVAQLICINYSVKPGKHFSIRGILKDKPFINTFFILLIILIISILLIRTFEFGAFLIKKTPKENAENNLTSVINSIWLIFMNSFGISFGDYYPKTFFSRILIIITTFLGLILLSYILKNLMRYTIMTESEKKVFLKMKKLNSHENLEFKSVQVIYYLFKLRNEKRKYNIEKDKYFKILNLKKIIINFLMFNRHLKNFVNQDKIAENYSIPVDDLLNTVEKKIDENLQNFEASFSKLDNLDDDLDNLLNLQKIIIDNMNFILSKQKTIGIIIVENNNQIVNERIKNSIFKKKSNLSINLNDRTPINNNKKINKRKSRQIQATPIFKRIKKKLEIKLNNSLIPERDEESNFVQSKLGSNSKLSLKIDSQKSIINLNNGSQNPLNKYNMFEFNINQKSENESNL